MITPLLAASVASQTCDSERDTSTWLVAGFAYATGVGHAWLRAGSEAAALVAPILAVMLVALKIALMLRKYQMRAPPAHAKPLLPAAKKRSPPRGKNSAPVRKRRA